ncbi:MAG: MlaD family protein [Desulfobacterales bacterium]
MSATPAFDPRSTDIPEAEIQTARRRRLSLVWLIPLVAALIGGWLAYKALSEKGPRITITFPSAEGIEAGKTKVRFKNVELGVVTGIDLSEDVTHVVVTADLAKQAVPFLTESARFWVVRARVASTQVTGLGTLFSGAYITFDPGEPGKSSREFEGLKYPPIVTTGLPGRHFKLSAMRRGSLDIGSPVFYRQINAGQVVAYHLDPEGHALEFTIFIHAPYDRFVRRNSRFWNASGVDLKLDTKGIRINTESLGTILQGGVAFDLPGDVEPAEQAPPETVFTLYEKYDDILEQHYTEKKHWLLFFDSSVRGLSPGAPVEFRGIHIGQVKDIRLEIDFAAQEARVPVLIETEPERILTFGDPPPGFDREKLMNYLVAQGLRAQLKTGNLLTGQLFVDLDYHTLAEPAEISYQGEYPVLPTVKAPLDAIAERLVKILTQFEQIPFSQIGSDLGETASNAKQLTAPAEALAAIRNLREASADLRLLMGELRTGIAPEILATLSEAQNAARSVDAILTSDSPLQIKLKRAMDELSAAARSFRFLTEYLERHPEALIQGKGDRE